MVPVTRLSCRGQAGCKLLYDEHGVAVREADSPVLFADTRHDFGRQLFRTLVAHHSHRVQLFHHAAVLDVGWVMYAVASRTGLLFAAVIRVSLVCAHDRAASTIHQRGCCFRTGSAPGLPHRDGVWCLGSAAEETRTDGAGTARPTS